jgi:hypothetical protein
MENENDYVEELESTETTQQDAGESQEEKDWKAEYGRLKREHTKLVKESETIKSNPINNPDVLEKLERLELTTALSEHGLKKDMLADVKKLGGVEALADSTVLAVLKAKQKEREADEAANVNPGSKGNVKAALPTQAEVDQMTSEEYEQHLRKIGKA